MAKFYKYVGDNYRALKKKVLEEKFTYFVVGKRWFIN
jgi:hypothetical protein